MIIGQLVFKPKFDQICFGKFCAQLTPKEYEIAAVVAKSTMRGRSIPVAQIYQTIHRKQPASNGAALRALTAHFANIRKKMSEIGVPNAIYQEDDSGYCFNINPPTSAPEALQEFLLRNTSEILGIIDARGEVTYVTRAVKMILGHPPEKFIGYPALFFDELIHPDDRARRDAYLARQQPDSHIVYRLKHANGDWVWTEIHMHRMYPDDPSDLTYVFSIRDVGAWMKLTGDNVPDFPPYPPMPPDE